MRTMSGRLFYSFVISVGSILAVLGFVIGQLFPIYAKDFVELSQQSMTEQFVDLQEQQNIEFSPEQQTLVTEVLAVSYDEQKFKHGQQRFYILLGIFVVTAFLLICYVSNRVVKNFVEPIDNITRTARELSAGNYRARAFANGPNTIIELRNSVNTLARNLQDITRTRQIEEERLKTLIENMGSALMMLNREGNISIVNKNFIRRFDLDDGEVYDQNFSTLGLPDELDKFINQVFLTELPYRKQLTMVIGHETAHLQAYGAPVIGENGRWLGVVIVMHDVSEILRLEQIRRDFVANVSHELRTPVTSIKGFSETLLDGAFKDEQMLLSFLEIIHKESNRLQMLVNDLLELSKIEQHGFVVDLIPTSLQDVLVRVVELTSPKMDAKDMQFAIDMPNNVVVQGEFNRLIQIFTNIVANAIIYSPEKTTVSIRVSQDETYGIIEVVDEGVGIEKVDIPRVFERFYRVDKARTSHSGGTGLGLAIVKHLLEAHQGRIRVTSEVGKGTTMTVYIPLAT